MKRKDQSIVVHPIRIMTLLISALMLSNCAVGPVYQAPQSTMPDNWTITDDPALIPDSGLIKQWWTLFDDQLLNNLIHSAKANNRDLMVAIARVEEAKALLGFSKGRYKPQVDAQADITRINESEKGLSSGMDETIYITGVEAGWEIDLFGRIRYSVDAAEAEVQASEEDRNDVLISLYANVALAYLEIRTFQARLVSAFANIQSQQSVLALTESRFQNGLAASLDVAQAQRILASTEAEVPPLKIGLSQAINRLAVLLGKAPHDLPAELHQNKSIPLPPSKVTVGLPVNLLRQRPDIRFAERQLATQTARIGILKAELYPKLSLIGSFGYEAINIDNLLDTGSGFFTLGPSLRWNIFNGGRIRSLIEAQNSRAEQAFFRYEQSVLEAIREAENALVAYIEDRSRLAALKRSVDAARRSVELATDLYKQGLVDFQQVLDAQRDQFNFESQYTTARGNSAANFARLYVALGGGWDPQQSNEFSGEEQQVNSITREVKAEIVSNHN